MVSLEGVRARARQLGHPVVEPGAAATTQVSPPPAPTGDIEDVAAPPPGTMLVPIDAWDKMLLQLGNLHQAGQQLAEARERAARAETEAEFLRERLAELRATPAPAPEDPGPLPEESPIGPEPGRAQPVKLPRFSAYLWRMAASGRRK